MYELAIIGACALGASIGLFLGIWVARKIGLTPAAKEFARALDANEEYFKTMIARFKGRLKEYEQPSELQRFASHASGQNPADLVGLLGSELANIKGLPTWLRPFIPAIQSYIKENPETVQALISKFSQGFKGQGQDLNTDSL